jgi:hypothetical protein
VGLSETHVRNLVRAVKQVHTEIVDKWREEDPMATTDNMNKLAAIKPHEEQLAEWDRLHGK